MSKLKEPKRRVLLNKVTHSVRGAQAILQYGVGAMVDFPDQTLMTAAPEYWDQNIIHIHDERLEKALRVKYFGMPGGKDEFKQGISYVRFPQWYFCPQCRVFQPLKVWEDKYQRSLRKSDDTDKFMRRPRCVDCRKDLVVTRIVSVCPNGHIDDFPWIQWVHDRSFGGTKKICENPQLIFTTGATSAAGLEGLIVQCKTCKARTNLNSAFNKDAFKKLGDAYRCTGNQPWKNHNVNCDEFPVAKQRGASSVYNPKIVSSLVIPPYSNRDNVLIENSEEYNACLIRIADYDENEKFERIEKRLDEWAHTIAIQTSVTFEKVRQILERRLLEEVQDDDYRTNSINYRLEEFLALTGKLDHLDTDDFIREVASTKGYDIPGVCEVALLHKVREVRALTGFTRIIPPGSSDLGDGVTGFVSSKEPQTKWYPAYQVRGEGIFIEFDYNSLQQWVINNPKIIERTKYIYDNYRRSFIGKMNPRTILPQFVFLHTLSHLLIRELSFECGYTAASLRERLYYGDEQNPIAGILIYTASGDSEGTLGGLVRQGYSDTFPRIFRKAIESSRICSNDPVCISSKGQGSDALNLGACHSCVLLPETSCEEFNVFLDRATVSGTFDNSDIGFYSQLLI